MTTDANPNPPASGLPEPQIAPKAQRASLLKLPGLMAISVYMILLAVVAVVYVVQGRVGPVLLVFPVLFIAGGFGLLLLLRWAWALTLAAVALLAGWFFWTFVTQHLTDLLVLGLINLVCFLYLVRTDVRGKLH
jgi:hypothetical protein